MVNRLKKVIANLIGPAQASFIPGRLSTDNIVVLQEVVHSMRRKKGKKGWMLLKLDLEKAYDRVRWDYLEDTLVASGLSEKWVRWILECVTGPSMHVLWNGEKPEAGKPERGLRQGDPLSPYLFVMCQKVSLEKSKIYFSANVTWDQREEISGFSGIQQTCDLGKYLGMPVYRND
ncbi:unnamed protein product [Microthlaspi erraticum]|uniref:Reverse transcriptase domain-containing protein n=1 Tax=Microthlaspi erraticum TaxID=1685480 RepID=A0A6D2KT01_9BRAS|nr:unnamed protein product [Microthlaspi erraticum]